MAVCEHGEETLAAFQDGKLALKDFEWEPHLRPSSSPSSAAQAALIPEIDLQPLHHHLNHASTENPLQSANLAGYADLVSALSRAASSLGFFQVFNHGISLSALDTLYAHARKFFSLPLERKYEMGKLLQLHRSTGPSGYLCGNAPHNPNKWWSESLRIASSNQRAMHLLAECLSPLDLQEQQAFCDALKECSIGFPKLAQDITVVLLEGLGLDGKGTLGKITEDGEIASFKLSHYPPCPQPDMTLGLPPHADVSIVTVLWQDQVGGLQVRVDGEWVMVKPRRDALVINIGDVFQIWSNDRYQSGFHRPVLNASRSRYSMVYFHNIGVDPMIYPIPELLERTKESAKFQRTLISKHRAYVRSEVVERQLEGVNYLRC